MKALKEIRYDLQIVASWINPGSRVLDLGCGEGILLQHLKHKKDATCTGIENEETKVLKCIEKGLTVVQGDINEEVRDYQNNTFDYIILSQTLQQVFEPEPLIQELLRIGRQVIVSFPNFSHWNVRMQIMFKGMAPVSPQLPYAWYNTPNIRTVTIKDFKKFVKDFNFKIVKEVAINTHSEDFSGRIIHVVPNLRATYGIFMIERIGHL